MDGGDEYADDDDFEASVESTATGNGADGAHGGDDTNSAAGEDELRPPAAPNNESPPSFRQRSQALQDVLAVDDDTLLGADSDSSSADANVRPHGGSGRRAHSERATRSRVSGRHVLSDALWTFSICVTRIRGLQIPVATRATAVASSRTNSSNALPAIRELRVFAMIDKRAMQSQGSVWKREPRIETPRPQRRVRDRPSSSPSSRTRSRTAVRMQRYSGFLDEATWRNDHGTLAWTLRMEQYRHLKASAPRVKVLVFGIHEHAADATVNRLREDSALTHSESIVSCGWFFLDLRTPDLPAKWLKLQNARFGGELLVSTHLTPHSGEPSATAVATASVSSPVRQPHAASGMQRSTASKASADSPTSAAPIPVEPDGECLRLGASGGTDVFVLSCLLRSASNLTDLVAHALGATRTDAPALYARGFWLSYALFGVVVRTDVFHDLARSEFPAIRDSFRVQSCVRDVAAFIARQQCLEVYLCTYDHVLAGVEVPLTALLESRVGANTGDLFMDVSRTTSPAVGARAVIDGSFSFPAAVETGAFLDACVAVECVQTAAASRIERHTDAADSVVKSAPSGSTLQQQQQQQERDTDSTERHPESPHAFDTESAVTKAAAASQPTATARVSLDYIRLSSAAIAHLVDEDGVSLTLSVGAASVAGAVRFSAFTKTHALGDNDALVLQLPAVSEAELARAQISVQCVSTASQHRIGVSQSTAMVRDPQSIASLTDAPTVSWLELPVFSGRERVGECVLLVELRAGTKDETTIDVNESESQSATSLSQLWTPLPAAATGRHCDAMHVFRVFLQLASLRDFAEPQEFAAVAYANPFTGRGRVEVPDVQVVRRGEVRLDDAFCIFEIVTDAQQFKHAMEASVAIDFVARCTLSNDGNAADSASALATTGTAVFSLNFLFFSPERFCCSAATCGATFASRADGETHWREIHATEDPGAGDVVHAFKSCSIELPVISTGDNASRSLSHSLPSSSTPSPSVQRIGTVGVVAYAEDMGELSAHDAVTVENMFVPHTCVQDVKRFELFRKPVAPPLVPHSSSTEGDTTHVVPSPTVAPAVVPRSQAPVEPISPAVSRAEATADATAATKAAATALAAAHARELAQLRATLEREKQQWLEAQQHAQTQWTRRVEAAERARMAELEREWARREEERSALLRTAQSEYERLEHTLRTSLLELEARERRLSVAEHAQQREQQTQRDELALARRRLESEHAHSLALAHKQTEARDARVRVLETQVRDAEQRARQVEADFAEYRAQQRKVPEARLRDEIAALRTSLLELEKQKLAQTSLREAAERNAAALTVQLERMARVVQTEKRKHEARVADELEKLRVKYVAREEKYVLDGDREELRAIKHQLDELKGLNLRPRARVKPSADVGSVASRSEFADSSSELWPSAMQTRGRGDGSSSSPFKPRRSCERDTRQHERVRDEQLASRYRRRTSPSRRVVQPLRSMQQRRVISTSDSGQRQSSRRSSELSVGDETQQHWQQQHWQQHWQQQHRRGRRLVLSDDAVDGSSADNASQDNSSSGHDDDDDDDDDDDNDRGIGDARDDTSGDGGSSEFYEHDDDDDDDSDVAGPHMSGSDGSDRSDVDEQRENADSARNGATSELARLEHERTLLLASGAYTKRSYLVRELTRRIAVTRASAGGGSVRHQQLAL